MKEIEKIKARELRGQGLSMNEIVRTLGVAKSSVSFWVRDIELTVAQKKELSEKGRTKESVEKRRISRLTKENARRQFFVDRARNTIKVLSKKELFWLGLGIYMGEGSKTKRGTAELSNADPRIVRTMMRFFKEVCSVPNRKFRAHVHIHPHLDQGKAERYWSKISGIPKSQFYKTSSTLSRASKGLKDSLPYGTFSINVHDTVLWLTIRGWMEGTYGKFEN